MLFSRANIADSRKSISVDIDGHPVRCFEGDTVAAVVLLDAQQPYRRSILSQSAREPLCMMGVCYECLIEIDGVPNQQGCLINVEPGMQIKRQLEIRAMSAKKVNGKQ